MKRDYFICKTQISFAIASDDSVIDPASITDDLQLKPSRMRKIGDTHIGKTTGMIHTYVRTVWTIESEWTILEEETVSHHIEYFKEILLPKVDIVKKYKEDNRFDVTFWIWIETDNAGAGFDLYEKEMTFLSDFSNRVHFSVLPNQNFDSIGLSPTHFPDQKMPDWASGSGENSTIEKTEAKELLDELPQNE